MKIDLQQIFDEYRGLESAQIRRNLCTALAAVADSDSLKRLVSIAMTDADETVRARALAELVKLNPGKQATAVAFIAAAADKDETKGVANYLLAQLQLAGAPITDRAKGLRETFDNVRAAIEYVSRRRTFADTWSLIGKAIVAAFTGATFSIFLIYAYIWLHVGVFSDTSIFFLSIIVTVMTALLMAYFARPFGDHFVKSSVATMIEVMRVCAIPAVSGVVLFLMLLLANAEQVGSWALAICFWLLLIATVRLFTICGRLSNKDRNLRYFGQVIVGFSAGMLVCIAFPFASHLLEMDSKVVSILCVAVLIPMALGLGAFFAQIDRSATLSYVEATTAQRVASYAIIAIFACCFIAPGIQVLRLGPGAYPQGVEYREYREYHRFTEPVENRTIEIGTPAKITIDTSGEKASEKLNVTAALKSSNCTAELFGLDQKTPLGHGSGSVYINQTVVPGQYTLSIHGRLQLEGDRPCAPGVTIEEVVGAFGRLLSGTAPLSGFTSFNVTVRLKPSEEPSNLPKSK
jgi:hypothetical protein